MSWQDRAPCRGQQRRFFPAGGKLGSIRHVCDSCPFEVVCLWDAMVLEAESGHRFGVWGGLTRDERKALDRRLGNPGGAEYERRRTLAVTALGEGS